MWQLLDSMQLTKSDKSEDRDWMQTFCEEIVEPECVACFKYTVHLLNDLQIS